MKDFLNKTTMALACGLALAGAQLANAQIPEQALEMIIDTLEAEDYSARHAARMELQDFVSEASAPGNEAQRSAVQAQLLDLLDDDLAVTTRLWLLRQIVSIGDETAAPSVAALLSHPNPELADAARMTLGELRSKEAIDLLIEKLSNATDSEAQRGLIDSLTQLGSAKAIPAISKLLASDDEAVVSAAAKALAKIGGSKAEKALYQALDSKATSIQLALVELSGKHKRLSQVALEGSNRTVRSAALQKCVQLNARKSAALLETLLQDANAELKLDLYRIALESESPLLAKPLLDGLASADPELQVVILGTLDSPAFRPLEPTVIALASSENEQLKIQAIDALGRIGSIDSLPVLLEGIQARGRDVADAAADAIASAPDSAIDDQLLASVKAGEEEARIVAMQALAIRASDGAPELVTALASDHTESIAIRDAAIEAVEEIGTTDALPVLVSLIVETDNSKLRRTAQKAMKRISLRLEDNEATWNAFADGFEAAQGDEEATLALVRILDSAATPESIAYAKELWKNGDEKLQNTVIKVLSSWRNWDGGFALLEIAKAESDDPKTVDLCFSGIGRLILGSDYSYDFQQKFDLTDAALKLATTPEQRNDVINGFRYSTWREMVHVSENKVDPQLKEAVLRFTGS
ncbi:HEAT repeat domain-containing protein [Pelagicoccus sp. SDUM812003]|uniref:HEAT repeat domain-containing protein n=1 Tax=Pelagicoccus sp. SDUM812003 TaxID=3041267 RepID=UPI00280D314A|nr:HEAT repeat domain-containing protein [Pelagicoccus sp. SDUM812003]MDQ8203059.1 HEAT repeat domain-containing protein [Pelagicoccus sp. SDUM812003]